MNLLTLSVLGLAVLSPAEADAPVDYQREVKPLLAARCYACHGAVRQKGDLRLDTVAAMKKGGANGPVIVPGKGKESPLVRRLHGEGDRPRMPPAAEGEALEPAHIALLVRWLDEGARGPSDEQPEPDPRDHWAFRPPARPPVPKVKDAAWGRNPVDAFLAAEHERHGLTAQGPAERRLLLRRVYLDLVGLPPTREQMEAFARDDSADAYEKAVDRLLASPQYGERWARHWMDVWRYSDWWGLGAEVRNSQKHVHHWRDWIVESLNEDRGYDRMVVEMLAADEVAPEDLKALRATGYLVRQYFKFNRTTWLDETVEHTAKAFLGLTFNCAKCHDHKYDPVSHADYYRFRAFFEPYQVRHDMLPGEADLERNALPRAFDCNLDAPTYLHLRGDERHPKKDRPIAPGLPDFLVTAKLAIAPVTLPPEAQAPGLRAHVLKTHLDDARRKVAAAREVLDAAKAEVAQTPKAPTQAPGKTLFAEDFKAPAEKRWQAVAGEWKHEGGALKQLKDGAERAVYRLREEAPADFEARFRFRISGGKQWKSVGLVFDGDAAHEVMVYLSAYAGGPKAQLAYKNGGDHVYPVEATQARAVPLNEPQELEVRVRGPLVNVRVNGADALAYRLPVARRKGHVELVAFDATASFEKFELKTLPAEAVLREPGKAAPTAFSPEQAAAFVSAAEKELAHAELLGPSLEARAAADRASVTEPQAARTRELKGQAARSEHRLAVARAEVELAKAALDLLRAAPGQKKAAEQKQQAAKTALEAANKRQPGEAYTPLLGSLKTAEDNLETEASRRKPYPATSTGRRTALARWITDARNPLAARVAVNHVWARHFGQPLVPTVFDLGRKGTPPTHPALLDWLAVELIENKWSLKHLHRVLVTSRAYRMTSSSAGAAEANRTKDADNRWYWRMNPLRMESQALRDSLLHLAGDLDLTLGGPAVEPTQQEGSKRRSLYFFHSANERNRLFTTFDEADVLECYRRRESIVPQQALALANGRLALAQAERIARKLERDAKGLDDRAFVKTAFTLILAVEPTADEQAACEAALVKLTTLIKERGGSAPGGQARAQLVSVLLNHNDFITIR